MVREVKRERSAREEREEEEETWRKKARRRVEVRSRHNVSSLWLWPQFTWGVSRPGCVSASWKLPSERGRPARSGSPGRELNTGPSWTTATLRLQRRPWRPCRVSVWMVTVCRLSWPRANGEAGGPDRPTGDRDRRQLPKPERHQMLRGTATKWLSSNSGRQYA